MLLSELPLTGVIGFPQPPRTPPLLDDLDAGTFKADAYGDCFIFYADPLLIPLFRFLYLSPEGGSGNLAFPRPLTPRPDIPGPIPFKSMAPIPPRPIPVGVDYYPH